MGRFVPFARPRGQPLLVLAMFLGGWLVLRVLLWEPPFGQLAPALAVNATPPVASAIIRQSAGATEAAQRARSTASAGALRSSGLVQQEAVLSPPGAVNLPAPVNSGAAEPSLPQLFDAGAAFSGSDELSGRDPGHVGQPWLPAFSAVEVDTLRSRWSGDAWLHVRDDSSVPIASSQATYGRSQAGAVLRYGLAPGSGHRPAAYARVTGALAGAAERELAAGFSARPVPSWPVRTFAELRAYDTGNTTEVRPAAFAVTELPPVNLPGDLRGEIYAQAGYVGGNFATAFADGQARLDRRVGRLGEGAEVRVGATAAGGAQKHAERLDIGPSVAVFLRLGEASARMALDYRFRVAGNAEPDSGPAFTFSAGF